MPDLIKRNSATAPQQSSPPVVKPAQNANRYGSSPTAQQIAQPAQKPSYTVTTTKGKQYTLDGNTADWIKTRYRADQAGTYGYDDADQLARKTGQMSAKWRSTYGNSNVDRQLSELGLPSEKNLEKYISEYQQWHTGGIKHVMGDSIPANAYSKIGEMYKQKWSYENTAEDQARKAKGIMPSALAAKYTDTEIDDELMLAGLPSITEFADYLDKYNNYAGIENLYTNAAGNLAFMKLNGIKDDNEKYTLNGEEHTGKEWYAKAFYDELGRDDDNGNSVYASIMPLLQKSTTVTPDPNKSYVEQMDELYSAQGKKEKAAAESEPYSSFSYNDFMKNYDSYYENYWKNAKLTNGQTMAEAFDIISREQDAQQQASFYDIRDTWLDGDKGIDGFIDRYMADYPDATPEQMFTDMLNNGVSTSIVHKTMKALRKGAVVDTPTKQNRAENGWGFKDIGDAYQRAIEATGKQGERSYKPNPENTINAIFGDKEAKASANESIADLKSYVDEQIKLDEADEATIDATKKAILNALYDEDGNDLVVTDVDGILDVLNAIENADFTNATAMRVALQDLGFSDVLSGTADAITANWSDDDKRKLLFNIGSTRLGEVAEEDRKNEFASVFANLFGTEASSNWYLPTQALEYEEFTHALDWAESKIADGEMTAGDVYNILAAAGYAKELEAYMPDAWHEAHFKDVTVPQMYKQNGGATLAMWEGLSPELRAQQADAMWADMTDEQKAEMFNGANWWKADPTVYRTFGQALTQQFEAVIPGLATDLLSGGVKLADMLTANITGRPELSETTQKWMEAQQYVQKFGSVYDGVNGAKVASVAADVAQEISKMYLLGTIGQGTGTLFEGTKLGGAIAKAAAGNTAVVKQAAGLFLDVVKASPYVVSAFAHNYSEYKALGASNGEATWNAMITGLTEGVLEGMNFDKLWGKAIGQEKFAQLLMSGKDAYLYKLGVVARARLASMAVSGLGEFTEEGIGYVVETYLKMRHSDTWGAGTEWSVRDGLEQAMMGFLVGAIGGGLSSGSITEGSILMDYAMSSDENFAKFKQVLPDVAAAMEMWPSLPESVKGTYENGGATVLSSKAYGELMDQVKVLTKDSRNAIDSYEKAKAAADAKLDEKLKVINGYAGKAQAVNTKNGAEIAQFVNIVHDKLGIDIQLQDGVPIINQLKSIDEQVKAGFEKAIFDVRYEHDTAVGSSYAKTETSLQNAKLQLQMLQKTIQEHYAGIYLMSKDGIMYRRPKEVADGIEKAYQNGAKYEPGQATEQRANMAQSVDSAQATEYNNITNQEGTANGREGQQAGAQITGEETAARGNAGVSGQTVAVGDTGGQEGRVLGRENPGWFESVPIIEGIKAKGIEPVELRTDNSNPSSFYGAIGEAKANNPFGAFVTQHDADQYGEMQTFLSEDNGVGVAVTNDGDIVSVFKNPSKNQSKKASTSILFTALENGGKKLDNFNSADLSEIYLQHGFTPVARIEFNDDYAPDGWNYERDGRPDILFWVHNGDSAETILEKMGTYEMPDVDSLPLFDGENAYDEAKAYRDSLVDENTGWTAKQTAETAQAPGTRRLTDDEVAKVQQAVKDIKYKGEVTFVDDPNAEDAWIDDNGNITINRANISEAEAKELSDNPAWWLLKHEFTHFIEGTAEYDAYASAVQDILRRRFGDNYGKVLDAVKQDYAQRGRNLDDTGALRELVAKFSQSDEILNNEETINAFVREQGNIADRIYNWIRYKINDLKLRRNPNSALARELLRAERLYAQAYRSANRKAPSSNETRLSTGRSLSDLTREYAGVANPRTGVTAEEDAAYMKAALAGDTETAGRMVRDMYERNGLMHVYRGEPQATGSWTQVDMDKFKGPGMFAATDIDTARASEYTQSYAREDLKTKPLSYGDEMPVLQQFADGVAQRIGRGMNLLAESYYMDDEGNTYAEDGKGREHHWALRDADTGDIFADSTELTTLADAAKRKAARLVGGNAENIYNSISDPFAGRILDLFVKFDNANEHNARGDEWDKIQLNAPKGVTLYRIEVTNDPNDENTATVTAYPIDESFDSESSSASERKTKSVTFTAEDDLDYSYKLENAFRNLFGPKSDVADFFMDYADWNEDGATLEKVGIRDKNGKYVSPELFPDAETISTDELAARDKAAGYDGSIIRNVRDGGSRPTTDTVSFNPNFIKSADAITYDDNGNIIPLSQRGDFSRNELRYSTGRSLNELLQQYGAIEQGRNPRARDTQVPRRTNDNNRVSQWIRSLVESDKLTDDQAQNVLRMVVEQDYGTYVPTSQAERMQEAREYIAGRQPLQAQQEFHDIVMQGKFGVKTNALGIQLLSDASARGDIESVLDIASDLQLAATEAGQSAQIFNVLKELKGVGSAWYMQKVIDRMNSKYADRIAAGKMQKIAVDPALMADLAKATTVDQIAAAEEAVAKDVARQLPLTWDDRLSSWRYFSMLANPTTHIRNITGNLLMKGLNAAKDVVATGIEKGLGIDQNQRAHAVLTSADRSTWGNFAQQSYEEQAKNLSGGGKLGFETFIKQNMRSFDTKWVNALAKFNFNALEGEDIAFIRPAYKTALMQYMKAQGYTLNNEGKAGKVGKDGTFTEISKAEMNAAIDWASNQAWKATFRDASSLATMLNKLSKENAVSRLLVEGVMPFKKTPVNIAKRGLEYSPAGIIMGTTQLLTKVKQGKMSAASAIDNLASGITGTALMALGVFLAKAGVIRAGGEDKKKYETYLQDTGDQTYSFKFGDASVNMSSIAPATIPLFMGVALQEMIGRSGDSVDLSTITDVLAGTLNPFMEMSFMSSLNSALKNYNNEGIGGALGSTLMTAAQNYGSQYLPTLGGKVAQFIDPTVRSTKSDATSPVGGNMDYYWRSLVKKVPGAEATLQPDVDVWGRTNTKDSFGDWALDFANKFILPTNVKVSNRDAVDKELIRVVESTGVTDFLPSDGNKYFTVKGVKYTMNAKQYAQYSQERGQAAYAAIKDVMQSSAYVTASDEDKANMLNKAKEAAYKAVNNIWKEKLGALG